MQDVMGLFLFVFGTCETLRSRFDFVFINHGHHKNRLKFSS